MYKNIYKLLSNAKILDYLRLFNKLKILLNLTTSCSFQTP
jgi:hypothetical protein